MEWSQVLAESSIPNYRPMDDLEDSAELSARIFKILKDNLPAKHLWKSLWCDGQELTPGALDILANDLIATKYAESFYEDLSDGSYIRGSVGVAYDGTTIWIRWGVGCPMDSGCDEILTAEYHHEI